MKISKSVVTTSLLTLSLFSSLYAETATVIFVDQNGKTEVIQSAKSIDEVNAALGVDNKVGKGQTTLIIKEGEKPIWTNESPSEVDKRYGGDGNPEIKLVIEEKEPSELPPTKEKKPIEIFDDIDSDEIALLDGQWETIFESTKTIGCSDMMKSILEKFTPKETTVTLKFSKPFNPTKDLMNGQFKWTKIGTNRWKGIMYKNNAMPQGMSMEGTMFLGVKSAKKIKARLEQKIVLPKEIAMMMGSSSDCKVVSTGYYARVGEK